MSPAGTDGHLRPRVQRKVEEWEKEYIAWNRNVFGEYVSKRKGVEGKKEEEKAGENGSI